MTGIKITSSVPSAGYFDRKPAGFLLLSLAQLCAKYHIENRCSRAVYIDDDEDGYVAVKSTTPGEMIITLLPWTLSPGMNTARCLLPVI